MLLRKIRKIFFPCLSTWKSLKQVQKKALKNFSRFFSIFNFSMLRWSLKSKLWGTEKWEQKEKYNKVIRWKNNCWFWWIYEIIKIFLVPLLLENEWDSWNWKKRAEIVKICWNNNGRKRVKMAIFVVPMFDLKHFVISFYPIELSFVFQVD